MEIAANTFFEEAKSKLKQASDELYRPEEDVVTYLVCQNSHIAIENYLKGFLVQHEIDLRDYQDVDSMYTKCRELNRNFEQINLSGHACDSHVEGSDYCNSKVSRCYELANNLDSFMRKEEIIS